MAHPAPSNLTADAQTKSSIYLQWQNNYDYESIKVYRDTSSGVSATSSNLVEQVDKTEDYLDTGLSEGTTYYYVVTGIRPSDLEESDTSNEASSTTSATVVASGGGDTNNVDPVDSVDIYEYDDSPEDSISVGWVDVDDDASDFIEHKIYRDQSPNVATTSENFLKSESTSTLAIDSGLKSETTYYYAITRLTDNGESPPKEGSATTASYNPEFTVSESTLEIDRDFDELVKKDGRKSLQRKPYLLAIKDRDNNVQKFRMDSISITDEVNAARNFSVSVPPSDYIYDNQELLLNGTAEIFVDGEFAFGGRIYKISLDEKREQDISIEIENIGRELTNEFIDEEPDNAIVQDYIAKTVDKYNSYDNEFDQIISDGQILTQNSTNVANGFYRVDNQSNDGIVLFESVGADASLIDTVRAKVKASSGSPVTLDIVQAGEEELPEKDYTFEDTGEDGFVYDVSDKDNLTVELNGARGGKTGDFGSHDPGQGGYIKAEIDVSNDNKVVLYGAERGQDVSELQSIPSQTTGGRGLYNGGDGGQTENEDRGAGAGGGACGIEDSSGNELLFADAGGGGACNTVDLEATGGGGARGGQAGEDPQNKGANLGEDAEGTGNGGDGGDANTSSPDGENGGQEALSSKVTVIEQNKGGSNTDNGQITVNVGEGIVYDSVTFDSANNSKYGDWVEYNPNISTEESYALKYTLQDNAKVFDWVSLKRQKITRDVVPLSVNTLTSDEFLYDRVGTELQDNVVDSDPEIVFDSSNNEYRTRQKGSIVENQFVNQATDPKFTDGVAYRGSPGGNDAFSETFFHEDTLEEWELYARMRVNNPEDFGNGVPDTYDAKIDIEGDSITVGLITPPEELTWVRVADNTFSNSFSQDVSPPTTDVEFVNQDADVEIVADTWYLQSSSFKYDFVYDDTLDSDSGYLTRPYEYASGSVSIQGDSADTNISSASVTTDISANNPVSGWGPSQKITQSAPYPDPQNTSNIDEDLVYVGLSHFTELNLSAQGSTRTDETPKEGYESMSVSECSVNISTDDLNVIYDRELDDNRLSVISSLADDTNINYRFEGKRCKIFKRGDLTSNLDIKKADIESSVDIEDTYRTVEVIGNGGVSSGIVEPDNVPNYVTKDIQIRDREIDTEQDAFQKAVSFIEDNSSVRYTGTVETLPTFAPVGEIVPGSNFNHGQDTMIESVRYGKNRATITLGVERDFSKEFLNTVRKTNSSQKSDTQQ